MAGVNKAILLGNVGADPELKHGQSGTAVLRLRMATSESWYDKDTREKKEKTEWHTVVFFGNRAEGLAKHLGKGDQIYVEGRIQTRKWEDRDGNARYSTEIVGSDLQFAGGKRGGGAPRPAEQKPAASSQDDFPADDFGDDDIPF